MSSIEKDIACLDSIVSELIWIKVQREKFRVLFENENNRDLLRSAAYQFFYELNEIMIYELTLSISRLTDPYDKKNQNLSLEYFLASDNVKRKKELNDLYSEIKCFRNKIKMARNRIISHNDLNTFLHKSVYGQFDEGEDIDCINKIHKYLNIVSEDLKGSIFGDISTGSPGDVYDLLKILKYGVEVKQMWNSSNGEEKNSVKGIIIKSIMN